MKKFGIYFITLSLIGSLLISCGAERKDIELTFVFDYPLEGASYPSGFSRIAVPFHSDCKFDFLPKPINILRLDISNQEKETNAWYFENVGENTVDFSKLWLESYFRDSSNNYFVEEAKREPSLINWLDKNKQEVYIFCEECEVEEFNNIKVYKRENDILNDIKERVCKEDLKNIYILYNPISIELEDLTSEKKSDNEKGKFEREPGKEQAPKSSDAIGITPPPIKEPKRVESACNQISASNLEDFLSKVADKRIPSCEKDDMLKNYTRFFQSSAFVNIVDNNGSVLRRFGAKDYVTRLNGSGKQVFVQDGGEKQGNKYTELMVTEI